MQRLRKETAAAHARIEQMPFLRALQDGTLELTAYVSWLLALQAILEAVTFVLARTPNAGLQSIRALVQDRLPLLDRDIAWFHRQEVPVIDAAVLRAHVLAQTIRSCDPDSPSGFLGYLYVLEGSALGGLVLRGQVARCFGLEHDNGVAYLAGLSKSTRQHWETFGRRLNEILQQPTDQAEAVAAAGHAFGALTRILEVLYAPREAGKPHPVQELNADAGAHAVTVDSRELQAALLAGEISWRRFPYYEARYGERGRAFTRSDSAWLVQLAQYEQEFVDQQVRWLGRVLGARGMPRLLLELHLRELHAQLLVMRPERDKRYASLAKAADMLAAERSLHFDDACLARLEAEFDQLASASLAARLPRTGALIVSAVADDAAGIYGALDSFLPWLTDPQRFPVDWIDAVHKLLGTARGTLRQIK